MNYKSRYCTRGHQYAKAMCVYTIHTIFPLLLPLPRHDSALQGLKSVCKLQEKNLSPFQIFIYEVFLPLRFLSISLSETWLSEGIMNHEVSSQDYTVYRKDRGTWEVLFCCDQ